MNTGTEDEIEDDFPPEPAAGDGLSPAIRGAIDEMIAGKVGHETVVVVDDHTVAPPTERPQGAKMHPIGSVKPSPTNPRKTFKDLEQLAETIKAHGILQPLVGRPRGKNGSSYIELVFGERRLRAAKLAGLKEVPVLVREMSDLEVLEVQIVENVQRADVDALEEADGYKVLHEKHGYTVPAIAAKIGKSIAYVYARLKLCALGPEGRAALAEGKLITETALYIARIPLALQKDAVKELEPQLHESHAVRMSGDKAPALDPVGAREALARIQGKFMLRLADAPFDPKDAQLVPAAGACGACPKRSGNQPELFGDVKASDTCTDPTCFAKKRDAGWQKKKAEALERGQEVLEGKKAKQLFPYGDHLTGTSGMVDLDARDYGDSKNRTYRQRLGKRLEESATDAHPSIVTLVRTDDGNVHELVAAKDLKKLLPPPRVEKGEERRSSSSSGYRAPSPADKLKVEAEKAAGLAALALVCKKFEAKDLERAHWVALILEEFDAGSCDPREVLARHGIDAGEAKNQDAAIAKLEVPKLRALFVDARLAEEAEYCARGNRMTAFSKILASMKIDVKQLVAKELARLKTEAKKPPAPKVTKDKTAKSAKKASKKGVR